MIRNINKIITILDDGEEFPAVDQLQFSAGGIISLISSIMGDSGGHTGLLSVAVLTVSTVTITAAAVPGVR